MDKNLVKQINNIMSKLLKVQQRQHTIEQEFMTFKHHVFQEVNDFQVKLSSVNDEYNELFEAVDLYAEDFDSFAKEFWSEQGTPVLGGYSQDPYEDVQENLHSQANVQSPNVQSPQQTQAVYIPGNLQPQASVNLQGTQPAPPSGVK